MSHVFIGSVQAPFSWLSASLSRQLTTSGDLDRFGSFARIRSVAFHLFDDIHARNNGAEDNVFAVQPGSFGRADKELTAISVGPGVGHGQDAWPSVREFEVLVGEFGPVDGLASSAVPPREVTALNHKARNDSVKDAIIEAKAFLPSAESTEVFRGFWDDVAT